MKKDYSKFAQQSAAVRRQGDNAIDSRDYKKHGSLKAAANGNGTGNDRSGKQRQA